MKKKYLPLLSLALLLELPGCKAVKTPQNPASLAPGAYNSVDQQIFQGLKAVQASLNNLKATLQNPATAPTTVAILKPYFNQATTDYDIAEVAWQTYHAQLSVSSAASPVAAQVALAKVQSDLAATPKVKP